MVVYADILILVNFVVDYFLISIACRLLHKKPRMWRMLLSAALGGVFSLYILLPQGNFLLQTAVQIIMCMALCVAALGFESVKSFLRNTAVLFCVNFAYSGAMIAVWFVFKPHGMVINNSVVYFNISPLFLIIFSVIGYFCVLICRKLLKRNFSINVYCDVTLFCGNNKFGVKGIVDTGNSLTDVFGASQIFIADKDVIGLVLGEQINNASRFRKIPCNTITGQSLLDGYRIERAQIIKDNKKYEFKNPILAVSQAPLTECQIIISPEALNLHEV